MARSLESIKGGGGSIKVGATGTVGSLMTRELESSKNNPSTLPITPRRRAQIVIGSAHCCTSTTEALEPRRKLSNDASSSGSGSSSSDEIGIRRSAETSKKPKSGIGRNGHSIPMTSLDGSSTPTDRIPNRNRFDRKGSYNIVEVVDVCCGHPEKAWMTARLKKLGFSKLSQSIS